MNVTPLTSWNIVQCHDVVPNASFTRRDVSHCSVEEVKIVMFINQIGILISKSFDCVHSLLLCIFIVKTLKCNISDIEVKVYIFVSEIIGNERHHRVQSANRVRKWRHNFRDHFEFFNEYMDLARPECTGLYISAGYRISSSGSSLTHLSARDDYVTRNQS
jgi:hypothetical protein